ncbi:site-specific integrase [Streptomyces sp. NBC_01689]|uniref:site-specific integrase n=1 Tax=Streptomyces sp. NBC_01689 TaxID=2975911 RepID=UPI002E379F69|nr:site-specific integrase [Streptomyces sp. NBC_01689]
MPETTAVEVVDAELVDEDESGALLPAVSRPVARPLVDRHTMLRPGEAVPTTADAPTYSEADFRISQETADLLDEAPPANTSRTYSWAWSKFDAWCAERGRVPLPCTTATFVEYVGHLIREDMAPATIRVHMSAIRSRHPDDQKPGTKKAGEAIRAHGRRRAKAGHRPKKAPAVTTSMLGALVATCTGSTPREEVTALRDAALFTIGWGMLSRRSELAGLLIEQVDVEEEGVTVHVAFSKTDQDAEGEDTFIPADPDPAVCPVGRVSAWLAELRRQGITSGPLFRAVTRSGTIPSRSRGDFLTPDSIGAIVKHRAKLAGVSNPAAVKNPDRITAHGLRRGPAQYLARNGQDPTAQGRWKQGSRTVEKHYLAPARGRENNPFIAARTVEEK